MKFVVAVLAIVLVIGFVGAGYEINHLRTEVNGLDSQVQQINAALKYIEVALKKGA